MIVPGETEAGNAGMQPRRGIRATAFGGIFGGIGAAAGAAIPIGNPLDEAPGGLKKSGP